MKDMICRDLMYAYREKIEKFQCEACAEDGDDPNNFRNSDAILKKAIPMVEENRREWGLDGLVTDLEAVIINTEPRHLEDAAQELIDFTGYSIHQTLEDDSTKRIILKLPDSADIILKSRTGGGNPFLPFNIGPKSSKLPNTRLETLIFGCRDIDRYWDIQKERGVSFMQDGITRRTNYSFVQTIPSCFTGNSIGLIQWNGKKGDYRSDDNSYLKTSVEPKDKDYTKNIKYLDHCATRLESHNRDAAIIEFMELTNYKFDFAIYVKDFNSITNVARLSKDDYAQVFTTGIEPFKTLGTSGPTEKFVQNYGPRMHHMAFHTEKIEDTYEALVQDGMGFLLELVGSPEEGLKQTFTKGSRNTFLVNEYIHRYGDFDGFFTKSNVTDLTRSTDAQ